MFIGLRRDSAGQFASWLDGTPLGGSFYANWNPEEPNNVGGSENCAEIIKGTGKWNDLSCSSHRLAMCEMPKQCETGWTQFDECCYSVLTAIQSFDLHRSNCQNRGGEMVSISSRLENDFVQSTLFQSAQ